MHGETGPLLSFQNSFNHIEVSDEQKLTMVNIFISYLYPTEFSSLPFLYSNNLSSYLNSFISKII